MPAAVMLLHLCLCDNLQDILPELYCGHDAFVFSSRYEAWGMPVLEAMAAGLAVVATACLGLDTFARHGMNALLAAPVVRTLFYPLAHRMILHLLWSCTDCDFLHCKLPPTWKAKSA